MRTILIAELSTNHGGDMDLACDMVKAAADSGADFAKVQSYSLAKLNPSDSQREWLTKAHLDQAAHERIMAACEKAGIAFLSTPFDRDSLQMLRDFGLATFKIASSESANGWWSPRNGEQWFVSYPWGVNVPPYSTNAMMAHLTAIPLYPTPLEAVGRATLLDGWSDHGEGLAACLWALGRGVRVLEAHLKLPGRGRACVWDKTPADFAQLRAFSDDVETMRSGVATRYRERWTA